VITGQSEQTAKKSLPMAELIAGIQDQLDKTFAEHHGLAPVIRAQQWAANFRVFNLNFKDKAPVFDDDLGTITARSVTSTVLVQDRVLTSGDTTARQSLAILSFMDFYLAAMITSFVGSTSRDNKETQGGRKTTGFLAAMGHTFRRPMADKHHQERFPVQL